MTAVMLLLARFAIATPLFIIGDRLSVFISPGPFLSLMGRIGGYNHLKQLGLGSTIAGQLLVGAIGGAIFGMVMRRDPTRGIALWTVPVFIVLPTVLFVTSLWPVLRTSYRGFPIDVGRIEGVHRFSTARSGVFGKGRGSSPVGSGGFVIQNYSLGRLLGPKRFPDE